MKYLINILFISFLFRANAEYTNFTKQKHFEFGWTKWESDTTFNDDGTIQEITKTKLKKKHLHSTTSEYKIIQTKFDANGKWYFKQKVRGSVGCFHSRSIVVWTRKKKVNSK